MEHTSKLITVALAPRRAVEFVFREYIAPLSAAEKILLVAAVLCSLVSAAGVQQRLAATYGAAFGWAGAVGLELVYVGTALAGAVALGRTGGVLLGLSGVAALIAIVLNFAQHEAAGRIHWYSYVESVAFPALAVGCSMVSHAISHARHADDARRRDEAARKAEQRAERIAEEERKAEQARREREEQQRLYLESQREKHALEMEKLRMQNEAELAKIGARAATRRVTGPSRDVSHDADTEGSQVFHRPSGRREKLDREYFFTLLREELVKDPNFDKSEFARRHNIGRSTVNKLLGEMQGYHTVSAAD